MGCVLVASSCLRIHLRFTGSQEWTNYAGDKATLPNHPFLFVVPPSLAKQVASECDCFLEKGAFDVITYFGGYKTHKDVWGALAKRAHIAPHMHIFVTTLTVSLDHPLQRCHED